MGSLLQLSDVAERLSNQDADLFRDRVADLLRRKSRGFPGAQPVSFAKEHLRELRRSDYYLCEKTDGIRCLLYLSFIANPDGSASEANFLIDRKNDYYHVRNPSFHFPLPDAPPQSFHTETLLDGELVLDTLRDGKTARKYLAFDCLALDGQPMLHKTLDKRIGATQTHIINPQQKLFDEFPSERAEQPFEVVMKKMEKAYGIEMMFKDVLPNLPHGNDGLVFTCRTAEYTIGTDQKIIKWKPPEENTIDFILQLGEFPRLYRDGPGGGAGDGSFDYDYDFEACPPMSLLVSHGSGRHERFAALFVTDDEWRSMKSMEERLDFRIIECYKDAQGRWRFKREKNGHPRFRDDKTDANHISTVNSVLDSIEDAVSEKDLLKDAGEIKTAWKKREQEEIRKRKEFEEMERRRKEIEEKEKEKKREAEAEARSRVAPANRAAAA